MPAKQVIKFSSLSKTIHSLISTPSFTKMHSIRTSTIASCAGGVIFLRSGMLCFHCLGEEDVGIPEESLSFISQTGSLIMSSSQGLLLLGKENKKELLICNPATRRWAPLAIPLWLESRTWYYPFARPHLECHTINLNSSNLADGYTVIIPVLKDPQSTSVTYELAVYRNGKWDEEMCDLSSVGAGGPIEADMPVCLFNGWNGGLVIHYLCVDADRSIVAYDVGRNAFLRNFKLPEEYSWSLSHDFYAMRLRLRLRLFKWRSSSSRCETIAVVNKSQYHDKDDYMFTVWVLEDYESGSWTRVFQKTTPEIGVMGKPSVRSFILVMNPTGMGLVFATSNRVYAYQLDGPQSGRLQMMVEPGYGVVNTELIHYINTLRPVGGGETQSI